LEYRETEKPDHVPCAASVRRAVLHTRCEKWADYQRDPETARRIGMLATGSIVDERWLRQFQWVRFLDRRCSDLWPLITRDLYHILRVLGDRLVNHPVRVDLRSKVDLHRSVRISVVQHRVHESAERRFALQQRGRCDGYIGRQTVRSVLTLIFRIRRKDDD